MVYWEETDAPAPLFDVMGHAGALADRSYAHIAIIDVPAFLLDIGFAEAGEGGHTPSKRVEGRTAIAQYMGGMAWPETLAVGPSAPGKGWFL